MNSLVFLQGNLAGNLGGIYSDLRRQMMEAFLCSV